MKTNEMPKIDTAALDLTDREAQIVSLILKPDSTLRRSKPSTPRKVETQNPDASSIFRSVSVYANDADRIRGEAAYVWRMVAFYVSPIPAHHCMPTTAEFYLDAHPYSARRNAMAELDKLADRIVNSVPKEQWYGVRRWGQAYGMIGTPVVREGGTIVYR